MIVVWPAAKVSWKSCGGTDNVRLVHQMQVKEVARLEQVSERQHVEIEIAAQRIHNAPVDSRGRGTWLQHVRRFGADLRRSLRLTTSGEDLNMPSAR